MTIYFCNYISMLLISEPFVGRKTICIERMRASFLGFKPVKDGHD